MIDTIVEELARKRLGRTIKGKWRLDRLIGVGGMAAVYAATHRNGARVAIKMLHATISASTQIRARFVREGYLANKVDHAGVVRVLDDDIDDSDGAAFLVMDLVIGSTLSERAMERLLDEGEVLDVAEQVLHVLAAAHGKGIIHRDLKPDNLLVDHNGKVHVLDFGIARLLDENGSMTATKTGSAFGTPGFMAPEQALGKTQLISGRTDLYALGATLFALVCGDFVHAAENPQELMILVATQPARSLGTLAPHMAKEVIALIDKATRNEPANRWPSAEAMIAEVRRVRTKLGLGSTPVRPLAPGEGTPAPQPVASSPRTGAPMPMPTPLPASAPTAGELTADDLHSERPPALALPSHGEPEGVSLASARASSPSDVLLPSVDEAPAGLDRSARRRFLPLIVVGGGAVVIALLAVVASLGRADRSADVASASSVKPAASVAGTESTVVAAPAIETASATIASTSTAMPSASTTAPKTASIATTARPPGTAAIATGTAIATVPTATAKPALPATVTTKPAASATKRPDSLGY